MHILVACDAFKGSLSAQEACRTVVSGISAVQPDWSVTSVPLADGGEGTAEILVAAKKGSWVKVPDVMGPLPDMSLTAAYGCLKQRRLAVVEMARSSGLVLLKDDQRHPLQTTTYGTGQLLSAAIKSEVTHILLTLGGSATVDGGTGAARALGWRFLDAGGHDIPLGGGGLIRLQRIVPSCFSLPRITVLCDVNNPLCGPQGAAQVFAPQKGATPTQVAMLAEGLENLARMIKEQFGINVAHLAGGGAAGGFGAGAQAFMGGHLMPGVSVVMDHVEFERQLRQTDWVVTGEGCLDRTSLQGKVVSGVLDTARRQDVPVAVLAGQIRLTAEELQQAGIRHAVAAMPQDMPLVEALSRAPELLEKAARTLSARLHG